MAAMSADPSYPGVLDEDVDDWGGLLPSEPADAGLLQDALHGFYPCSRPRCGDRRKLGSNADADARAAEAVLMKQERHEAFVVASPCADVDVDEEGEYPMMPQGLLEDVVHFPAFVGVVSAPSAATRHGHRG